MRTDATPFTAVYRVRSHDGKPRIREQECLFYTGDVAEDQYYCSASCDLNPCEEGEECSLVPASCAAGSICGNGYVCSASATEEGATDDAVGDDEQEPCVFCAEFQASGFSRKLRRFLQRFPGKFQARDREVSYGPRCNVAIFKSQFCFRVCLCRVSVQLAFVVFALAVA